MFWMNWIMIDEMSGKMLIKRIIQKKKEENKLHLIWLTEIDRKRCYHQNEDSNGRNMFVFHDNVRFTFLIVDCC